MTLDDIFPLWIASLHGEVKHSSIAEYKRRWEAVRGIAGGVEAADFGRPEVRELLAAWNAAGISKTTQSMRAGVLTRLLAFAAEELGEDCVRPRWGRSIRGRATGEIQVFTPAEIVRITETIARDIDRGRWAGLGPLLSLLTGMRRGEVCALKWEAVDFADRSLTVAATVTEYCGEGAVRCSVGEPKTESGYRTIPMLPQLEAVLRRLHDERKPGPDTYVTGCKVPLRTRSLAGAFRRIAVRAGVSPLKFHALRHTFATMMVDTGADVKTVAVLMGHSSVRTTLDLYVHPNTAAKRRAMARAFECISRIKIKGHGKEGE